MNLLFAVLIFFNLYIDSIIVDECINGNTCIMSIGEKKINVRLIGIDVPEMGLNNQKGQPFSIESKNHLNNLIKGKAIHLNLHKWNKKNIFLGEVEINHIDVNLEMIQSGYAEVYRGYNIIDTRFYEIAEQVARIQKIGIWSNPNYVSPKDYRRIHKIKEKY